MAAGDHHGPSHSHPRRVVVTGLGVVSPLGSEVDEFYDRLLAGESGISKIERFDADALDFSTNFAGEIKDFDGGDYMSKKMARRLDDYIKYMIVAGKKAMNDAGFPVLEGKEAVLATVDQARCGVLAGSALGGIDAFADGVTKLTEKGHRKMNPFCIPFSITNMGAAMLAMELGFMGPNYSISTACATGNYCIMNAAEHIRNGHADLMLAGGSEASVIPIGIAGFISCKALSKRCDDPAGASRPWDVSRDGFVMGEGAGILVLEELEHAKARGANIICEFAGGAYTCDASHMTEPIPSGEGVSRCITNAMSDAGVTADEVTYVNAHATSTLAGDLAEYRAITSAIGHGNLKINGTKSMIGHSLGAAGAIEAVATVKALQTGMLHPTINVANPDPEVDVSKLVLGEKLAHPADVALSNSFGFGGHNSSIIFKKYVP
mmetsp:Transcript_13904/g.44079  ORF Transcript_13904/g.44079 Transcript_13904/m.44079 type:complete len:435 (-) Transcript_13904:91-1395(-)